jgi:hypothetical protein
MPLRHPAASRWPSGEGGLPRLKANLMERLRFFIEDHPWGVTGSLVAVLVAVVIAWVVTTSDDSQISDLKDQLAAARHKASSLRDRLEETRTRRNEATDHARTAGAHREKSRPQQSSNGAALDRHAQAGHQREQGKTPAKQTPKSSTIPDGVWRYGRDYEAGTYRARGGEGCFWATLRDANPSHVIDYDVSVRHPTVRLGPDTPFFKTLYCGRWVKTR